MAVQSPPRKHLSCSSVPTPSTSYRHYGQLLYHIAIPTVIPRPVTLTCPLVLPFSLYPPCPVACSAGALWLVDSAAPVVWCHPIVTWLDRTSSLNMTSPRSYTFNSSFPCTYTRSCKTTPIKWRPHPPTHIPCTWVCPWSWPWPSGAHSTSHSHTQRSFPVRIPPLFPVPTECGGIVVVAYRVHSTSVIKWLDMTSFNIVYSFPPCLCSTRV